MKEVVKKIVLYSLALFALWICGTIVLLFFDWAMKLNIENVIYEGFKVGLIAWILVTILPFFTKKKKQA